jgi:UDP-glucose 4,6-dehydratase
MILLLGATGYIGQTFAAELRRRGQVFVPLTRKALDYTDFNILFDYVRRAKPRFLINAAGYTGFPNVDACESAQTETLQGNVLFPQTVARVCTMTETPWGHVSSGCIYSGAKVDHNGRVRIERALGEPRLRRLFAAHPERFYGFTEYDDPNFCFRSPPCGFYSGTKALAEESLRDAGMCYIWRLRIPFDEFDHPRNYLSKIQSYSKVYNSINSLSNRGDFVRACLDLWERRAPTGVYNVTNPGAVSSDEVVQLIQRVLKPRRQFKFWRDDAEFYEHAATAPRSNCILDVSKLLSTGVKLRPVREALMSALQRWQPAAEILRVPNGFADSLSDGPVVPLSPHVISDNADRISPRV